MRKLGIAALAALGLAGCASSAADGSTQQFKSMARDEFTFGFSPVDESYLHETLDKMDRRLAEVGQFLSAISSLKL